MSFQFVDKGVLYDDNMPEVDFYRLTAFGMRDSPGFDVSPAIEKLGEINSGFISWFARPIEGTEVKVLTSADGEDYLELENNAYIQNAQELNENPWLYLRYFIISEVATILRDRGPQLFSVTITLSNQLQESWSKEFMAQLEWEGGSD